ncbi:MAG: NAD(P)/FAD-dependent oxidoreductase [Spirochaetota bacterium]
MKKTDVLIVGGSAAGLVTAQVGRSWHPEKSFLVVRDARSALIPCAIPYLFGSLGTTEDDILPDALATNGGAEVAVDRVTAIDRDAKRCLTASGEPIAYDKLVLATGSKPKVPGWLRGADLRGVYTVPKEKEYLDRMLAELAGASTVAVIGAGFIGVELADQLRAQGKRVYLVEVLPHVLGMAFDEEIALEAESILTESGVVLKCGLGVEELVGDERVSSVRLANGERLDVDAVVLSMGYAPETSLAATCGLPLNDHGFIVVDEYMRTSDPDVLAVGDCAEKRDFITRRPSGVMLASTACAEARVAAMNLFELCSIKPFSGTIAVYSTALGRTGFGTAGVTAAAARQAGIRIVTGSFTGVDRHPGALNSSHKQTVSLVAARDSGTVIGGGVIGGLSAGEITNVLGLVIQNRMSICDLLTSQIGTHPCLTASPAAYPLIKAAESVAASMQPVTAL